MELLTEGLVFPEGPTWHDGALWVSDVIAGGVVRIDDDGSASERYLPDRRAIGGLVVTSDGRLLATGRDLVDVATGAVVVGRPDHAKGFNDVGVDATGALLLGVLTYLPLAGETPSPGAVARVDRDGVDWQWFAGIEWPNGIGVLADGHVVAADYSTGILWSLDANGGATEICTSPSGHYDGLCVDDDDAIWVATGPAGTLERRSHDGRRLEQVDVPASFVTSACFSGADPTTLLVTVSGCTLTGDEGGAVLAVPVGTGGRPPNPAQVGTAPA